MKNIFTVPASIVILCPGAPKSMMSRGAEIMMSKPSNKKTRSAIATKCSVIAISSFSLSIVGLPGFF